MRGAAAIGRAATPATRVDARPTVLLLERDGIVGRGVAGLDHEPTSWTRISNIVRDVTGQAPRSFADFARDYAGVLAPPA